MWYDLFCPRVLLSSKTLKGFVSFVLNLLGLSLFFSTTFSNMLCLSVFGFLYAYTTILVVIIHPYMFIIEKEASLQVQVFSGNLGFTQLSSNS